MIREEYDVQRNVLSEKQSEEMKAIKKIVKTISQINENLFI
jgi:peptidyl-tRNA hydrolase